MSDVFRKRPGRPSRSQKIVPTAIFLLFENLILNGDTTPINVFNL